MFRLKEMLSEDAVALMMSTAYSAPYIDDVDNRYILSSAEVMKLTEMYENEAREYVVLNGIKLMSANRLSEDAYILCSNMLIHIGRFNRGYVPSDEILKYRKLCLDMVSLHTHPIPLPLPTLEDIISTQQVGYNTECVLSKIGKYNAKMICIEPTKDWNRILNSMEFFTEIVYKLVDKYIVVEDEFSIRFVPYPSEDRLQAIENEFIRILKGDAYIDIVILDMKLSEYTRITW